MSEYEPLIAELRASGTSLSLRAADAIEALVETIDHMEDEALNDGIERDLLT